MLPSRKGTRWSEVLLALVVYNHERTHQGKMCCGRTPMATFEDGKQICREKMIA